MRILILLLPILALAGVESPRPVLAEPIPDLAAWPLVFQDGFDGDRLDEQAWTCRTGTRFWSVNLARNVSVADGCMRIALRKEKEGVLNYTSGGIITRQTFRYGYYEARFRCPPGAGWHTSFWMMRVDGPNAKKAGEAVQEIDVCEQDSVNPHRFAPNLHRWLPAPHQGKGHKNITVGPDLSADFHVWGCLFLPKRLSFFFDGRLVHDIDPTAFPHGPQNIWLTSIAAPLGGTKAVDDTKLPASADFDYVRHWAAPLPMPPALVAEATPAAVPSPPATGADLDLGAMIQPVPQDARFSDPGFYIWCGSPVKGDDGRYHLFYSRWPRELGHYAWVTHSEVAHAVADAPLGPYRHHDVTLPARGREFWDGLCTHNPTILRANGKYYLYYMGNTGDGVKMKTLNWSHRNNQRIGVAVADRPEGPWQRADKPLIDATPGFHDAQCCANPSVAQRPDGGFLMVYKGVADQGRQPFGGPVVHIAATSDSPTGPFTKHPRPVFHKEGEHFAAEDPYIWRGADRYWAVVKDNAGVFTKAGKSLALWESADGLAWTLSAHPLVSTVQVRWADGTVQKLHSLERPQLLFDGGRPIALFCAVDVDSHRDHSFNIHIPLGAAGR